MPRRLACTRMRRSGRSPIWYPPVPAESISNLSWQLFSLTMARNTPSAAGERHILPRHTNSTRILSLPCRCLAVLSIITLSISALVFNNAKLTKIPGKSYRHVVKVADLKFPATNQKWRCLTEPPLLIINQSLSHFLQWKSNFALRYLQRRCRCFCSRFGKNNFYRPLWIGVNQKWRCLTEPPLLIINQSLSHFLQWKK